MRERKRLWWVHAHKGTTLSGEYSKFGPFKTAIEASIWAEENRKVTDWGYVTIGGRVIKNEDIHYQFPEERQIKAATI